MDAGELSHPASMPSFTKLLSIHLIFNEIVQHLTVPDLISCSAVSRGWCSTFRDFLHRNRECRLVLTWAIRPCHQLKELNQLLRSSTFPLPFNQLFLTEFNTDRPIIVQRCSPEDHEGLTPESYSTFLSKVHFTSFVIFWLEIDQDKTQCPAGGCMKKIMEVHAGVLETLTVLNTSALDSGSILDYFSVDPQIRSTWLAKLKTLKVGSVCNSGIEGYYTPTNHLEEVLKASPNLKRITGPLGRALFDEARSSSRYSGIIPLNKYRLITQVYGLSAPQLYRLAKERPELRYLSLFNMYEGGATFRVNDDQGNNNNNSYMAINALNGLFRSSYDSLRVLKSDIYQLAVLSREVNKGCWPLPNLSTLDLFSTYQELSYLKYINLQGMFPKLSQIYMWAWAGTGEETLDSTLLSYESSFHYAHSTVKSLHLLDYIPEEYLRIPQLTFPNLREFTYHNCQRVGKMCGALWKMNWDQVTAVKFCSLQINFDVEDSVFGLPGEEREFIQRSKLDAEAEAEHHLHYVSSKYSAFNFKSLKTLQLEFEECMMLDYYSTLLDYPCNEMQTFPLFSRVTALKLSREFPGLDIEITIEPEKILPGAEICDETYSRLLEDPRLYKISPCHHKLERPHRQSHFGLVKYKFNVVCK